MNNFLFPIYRILVPKPLRTIILKKNLSKKITAYFNSLPDGQVNDEQREIVKYLENNEIRIFPYPFHNNYSPDKIEVFYDRERRMSYVLQDGKRLYFKRRWKEKKIKQAYSDLMREQDINSPHRYLADTFTAGSNDVVADIGAAEGNFSLAVIEEVRKIYLFEYDNEWIEALKATFAPWPEKVEIIDKYVGDHNDDSHIRFDTFFESKKDITFLKIDVDGAEEVVLNSCKGLFSIRQPLKIALCTYHKNDDEKKLTSTLKDYGFLVTPSKGYMINYYDKKMKAPYLRRGLIRAVR
ncbi:MAG TPA: FkbM family methyltransferase [Bacteroidales bacterium]|nr:FkbM family methyltransferase [Bacteroidales bacterium]